VIEIVEGPGPALGLQGGRVIEPGDRSLRAIDDAVQVRADPVRAAFFEGVASCTLLGSRQPPAKMLIVIIIIGMLMY
jgi:hypothetical protein